MICSISHSLVICVTEPEREVKARAEDAKKREKFVGSPYSAYCCASKGWRNNKLTEAERRFFTVAHPNTKRKSPTTNNNTNSDENGGENMQQDDISEVNEDDEEGRFFEREGFAEDEQLDENGDEILVLVKIGMFAMKLRD
jgi:hypothetical protein